MKLKAKDQLHVSSVKADPIRPDEEFEVSDVVGSDLVKRGLATRVTDKQAATRTARAKKTPAPKNKKALAPKNKSK